VGDEAVRAAVREAARGGKTLELVVELLRGGRWTRAQASLIGVEFKRVLRRVSKREVLWAASPRGRGLPHAWDGDRPRTVTGGVLLGTMCGLKTRASPEWLLGRGDPGRRCPRCESEIAHGGRPVSRDRCGGPW